MNKFEFLRAQFALSSHPTYIDLSFGDILKILRKEGDDLFVQNLRTGCEGLVPRKSKAFYVDVKRDTVSYVQPVILMGSFAGIMISLLIQREPQLFNSPIPHTTRMRKIHEKDGFHYCFVKRTTMEQMMNCGIFIDCYEISGYLYGISEASIRTVSQKEKKHCLLDENTEVPRLLHRKIHPIVIYVNALSWEQLSLFGYSETDAKAKIESSKALFEKNRAYFHAVVEESSSEEMYHRLLHVIRNLRVNCWLPKVVERTRLI
ncbi:unnamed protein product [Auanema sp. JU1783]|nr:unnamed protein product [Auanema sp. JU1783]